MGQWRLCRRRLMSCWSQTTILKCWKCRKYPTKSLMLAEFSMAWKIEITKYCCYDWILWLNRNCSCYLYMCRNRCNGKLFRLLECYDQMSVPVSFVQVQNWREVHMQNSELNWMSIVAPSWTELNGTQNWTWTKIDDNYCWQLNMNWTKWPLLPVIELMEPRTELNGNYCP